MTTLLQRMLQLLITACLFSVSGLSFAYEQPVPDGFTDYLVFMGTGEYDPTTNPVDPPIVCHGPLCGGDFFHKTIMGRSDEDMAILEAEARAFFVQRFGIDVDDPANAGRILFQAFTFEPRIHYRAYTVADEKVPSQGWRVHDGGWVIDILDEDGYTLGGEWNGFHVLPGSLMIYGNYSIQEVGKNGELKDEFHNIFYRSAGPVVFDIRGEATLRCELSQTDQLFTNGVEGMLHGFGAAFLRDDGLIKWDIRAVLTFGPSEPFPGLGDPSLVNSSDDDD